MSDTPAPGPASRTPTPGEATRARFRRVDALLDAVLDRPPAERAAFLDAATADDPALRTAVAALLAADADAGDFLADVAHPDALQRRLQHALGERYRLLRRIGSGGMAHVYLADDVRHGRPVAIKAVATGDDDGGAHAAPGAVARFLAEVRVMARLQHPHLLPLLDSGDADGVPYLVMPFVDGETLRQRLAREGVLPVPEAVRLARAIAGALAHAHDAGVVHRDLKPENVLLRDGEPLVADFGIALAATATRLTAAGMVVGTPQYMAPEQVAGDAAVDARADVYALAAMLYEMLAGEPPHAARTARGVLVKVLVSVPAPVQALRAEVPAALSATIARGLAIAPADRIASARAFADALAARGQGGAATPGAAAPAARAPARWRTRAAIALVTAGVASAAVVVARRTRDGRAPGDAPVAAARFVVQPVAEAAIGRAPTLTPDGGSLVYAGAAATGRRLFVRPVAALAARALAGSDGALTAAVSPDGRRIAYVTDDDALHLVPLAGGAPSTVARVFRYAGVAWADTARLVVDGYGGGGLLWYAADGGPPHALTRMDATRRDAAHAAPIVLPDARTVIFVVRRDVGGPGVDPGGQLAVATLDAGRSAAAPYAELGARGRRPVAFVDGWLLWIAPDGARLLAQRLDTAARRLVGAVVPVLDDPDGAITVATLGRDGTLLYTRQRPRTELVSVDSTGRATPLFPGRDDGRHMNPRLSADGRTLVAQVTGADGNDAWTYDLATGTATRVTRTGGALGPVWTPDGRHVVFFSTVGGHEALWRAGVDGRTPPERLLDATGLFAPVVSPDGRTIVFQRSIGGTWSIWAASLAGGAPSARTPRPVVAGPHAALMPALSPDGRWLAFTGDATGRYEVYVRPFPGPGSDIRLSRDGGTEPAWSPDGRRLFFRGDRRLHVVDVAPAADGRRLVAGVPRVRFVDAFDGDMPMPHRNYDVARDGRVVMVAGSPSGTAETVVVVGWLAELRARLGAVR